MARRLTEAEEEFCQNYVAGFDLLLCFRRAYPNDKRSDNKARHQAKMILARDRVAERIKFLKGFNEYDDQSTPTTLKRTLLQWTHKYAGKAAGTAAMQILCRESGVGVEKIVIEDNTSTVDLQRNLFARRQAKLRGEEIPALLVQIDAKENLQEADFTIEDDEEEVNGSAEIEFKEDDELWDI